MIRLAFIFHFLSVPFVLAQTQESKVISLEEVRVAGAAQSKYLSAQLTKNTGDVPKADLKQFREVIGPIFEASCVQCHGPDKEKGGFRIDELDPDLVHGADADWWLEVVEVVTNGEMPPPEDEVDLSDSDREKVIDWLSKQILAASQVQRGEGNHSSFRRMTRYEFNYALQDLLGISEDFTEGLPQEAASEEGFRNSSEILQLTSRQFEVYREVARGLCSRQRVGEKSLSLFIFQF